MQESDRDILPFEPGLVLGGQYEVIKCLGIGRTGTVYLCKATTEPPYYLALKVLSRAFTDSKDNPYYARFRNEVAATYRVSHKNVVFTYEYISEPDFVAYTMEYVSGGSLASFLEEQENLEIPFIIHTLRQLCAGLQAIHDAGIVHRDLKPDNILLTQGLDAKITDFGIALTGDGPKLTAKGSVVGTIQYLSPEYLELGTVGPLGDIYALGTIGYELITGRTPFQDKSVFQTIDSKINVDPPSPDQLNPECPSALASIVMRALHREASKRYSSAGEMQAVLEELAEHYPYTPPAVALPAPLGGEDSDWIAIPTEIYTVKPTEMLELRTEWREVRAPTYGAAIGGALLGLLVLLFTVGWESWWQSWDVPDTVHVPLLAGAEVNEGVGTIDLATAVSGPVDRSRDVLDPSPIYSTLGDQVMARYREQPRESDQERSDEKGQKPKVTQEKSQEKKSEQGAISRSSPEMAAAVICGSGSDEGAQCASIGRLDLLVDIARLSSWPNSAFRDANSPLKLCLLGKDPFGVTLDKRLENARSAGNRKIVVRRLPINVESVSTARCHLLYSGEASKVDDSNPLLGLASRTTLTISEEHGGGMIQFKESNQTVRIEIDEGKSGGIAVKLPRLSAVIARG